MGYFFPVLGCLFLAQAMQEDPIAFAEKLEPTNKKPISEKEFKDLENHFQDKKSFEDIKKQIQKRGVLDVSKLKSGQVKELVNWLKKHHHGVMRVIKGHHGDLLHEIESDIINNRTTFVERTSPTECALFAFLSYYSQEEIENWTSTELEGWTFPEGWIIMPRRGLSDPIYEDNNSGYGGVAFVNHSLGQIVIAHRGTEAFSHGDRSNIEATSQLLKDLKTDLNEVAQQQIGTHQKHALAFAKEVGLQAKTMGYRIGIVGHSLGGWLAKLSSHALREEGIDSYVVCLDPPGTAEMTEKFYRARYGYQPTELGDFSNYFWLPNLVNCCGTHEGSLYQLYSDHLTFEPKDDVGPITYLLETHSSKRLLEAFPKEGRSEPKVVRVIDWPKMDWEKTFNHLEIPTSRTALIRVISNLWKNVRTARREYTAFGEFTTWENIKDVIAAGKNPTFELRRQGHYKIESYSPQELPLLHFPKEMRQFLKFFDSLRRQGSRDALEAFLKEKEHGGKELQFLMNYSIEGNLLTIKGLDNAAEFRRKCALLLRCYPEVSDEIKFQDFLIFIAKKFPRLPQLRAIQEELWAFPTIPEGKFPWRSAIASLEQSFTNKSTVIISGKIGSGKTELAKQWSEKLKKSSGHKVFYFDVSNPSRFKESLIKFGTQVLRIEYKTFHGKDISSIESMIVEELTDEPYVLIFDQADDLSQIDPFLSQKLPCKVLVTTTASQSNTSFREVIKMENQELTLEGIKKQLKNELSKSQLLPLIEKLEKSPSSIKIAVKYINKHGIEKFLSDWKESSNIVGMCAKALTEELPEAEVALRVLPFFNSTAIPKQLLLDWLYSDEKNLYVSKTFDPNEVLILLKEHGLVEEKNSQLFIDRKACQLIGSYVDSKTFPTSQEKLMGDFLQFLNKKISMNNIGYKDFETHSQLVPHIDSLLKATQEEDRTEYSHLFMALYNKSANHKLQSEDFIGAEKYFTEALQLAEKAANLPNINSLKDLPDLINKVERFLNLKESKSYHRSWLTQYTKSLHYLGKIYFQTERKELAKVYYQAAIELREKWSPKSKEEKIDYLIFRRQGLGWLLLDSGEKSDLQQAKTLYSKLYFEDNWSFNHTYCNRQLGTVYHKLAKLVEHPDIKKHYYKKALDRLENGGKDKGVPFKGALTDISRKKEEWKDSDAAVEFALARVLADPDNPFYNFKQAEAHFLNVLDIAKTKEDKKKSRVKKETLLRTYHGLAKLYQSKLHTSPLTKELQRTENEDNLAKAQGCALKAFSILGEVAFGENLGILKNKLKEELEDLNKILKTQE